MPPRRDGGGRPLAKAGPTPATITTSTAAPTIVADARDNVRWLPSAPAPWPPEPGAPRGEWTAFWAALAVWARDARRAGLLGPGWAA